MWKHRIRILRKTTLRIFNLEFYLFLLLCSTYLYSNCYYFVGLFFASKNHRSIKMIKKIYFVWYMNRWDSNSNNSKILKSNHRPYCNGRWLKIACQLVSIFELLDVCSHRFVFKWNFLCTLCGKCAIENNKNDNNRNHKLRYRFVSKFSKKKNARPNE